MKQLKKFKSELLFVLVAVLVGQLFFAVISPSFTTPSYEGRIYSTTGVRHKQEDLHKLNEAAHYFGQTMIGWLKFPHFFSDLQGQVDLPSGSSVSAHIQERQNIIFTVNSPIPLRQESLVGVKNFLQEKLNNYNSVNQTEFVLTNVDYELVEIKRSYLFGTGVALIATLAIAFGILFIRREFLAN